MTDQTNATEEKRDGASREWLAIGVGLTALLSIMAVIISFVALSSSSATTTTVVQAATPAHASTLTATPPPAAVNMLVKSDTEHGRKGPDGQWHDAFSNADFAVKAGQTVTVTVSNFDDSPHSFTAPSLGLNVAIPGGSEKQGHTVKFTFKAPSKPGTYEWFCAMPCDPWAMSHDGYMRGHVTVTA
jgi:plastocyanin